MKLKQILSMGMVAAAWTVQGGEVDKSIPFWNHELPMEERIDDILGRMTLDEKMSIICFWNEGVPRLGIEALIPGECLHGLAAPRKNKATVFPNGTAMAASWNPDLIRQVGTAVSDEARAQYHHGDVINYGVRGPLTFWSPVVNMARDPRWGRTQEGYGEDPHLVSEMAAAYVQGLSGDDPKYLKIAVGAKHFVANNTEYNRFRANAEVSEKQLREYYFPGYKAAVTRGGGQMVMTAYNRLNGIPCVINNWLVNDVLRKEWSFNGIVIGDYGSDIMMAKGWHKQGLTGQEYAENYREAAKMTLKARGINLSNTANMRQYAQELIDSGEICMGDIDVKVRDVMRVRMKLGIFDPPECQPWKDLPFETLGCDAHDALAEQMAIESAVLLKNDGLLPLSKEIKKVVVIGPNAARLNYGTYSGTAVQAVRPIDGIKQLLGADKVEFVPWAAEKEAISHIELKDISLLDENGIPTWTVEYFNNTDLSGEPVVTTIGYPHELDFSKPGTLPDGVGPDRFSVRFTTKLVPPVSGTYRFTGSAQGPELGGGIIMSRNGAQFTRHWTEWNKMLEEPVTLEAGEEVEYSICYGQLKPQSGQVFDAGWIIPGSDSGEGGNEVEAAKDADAVIAFMGLDVEYEREAKDRSVEGLPQQQLDLLKKVVEANPNTVVVLHNGSSIESPELVELVPALCTQHYPGQAGGKAIAKLLFGDTNFSGRLPQTWVRDWDDLPDFDDYDLTKGRTYWYFDRDPLFPFGYGLSYTTFRCSDLKVEQDSEKISMKLKLKNSGDRDGAEVVQVYVADTLQKDSPKERLKAFDKVFLKAGETKDVALEIPRKELAYWVDGAWKVLPGSYEIRIGGDSRNIRLTEAMEIE